MATAPRSRLAAAAPYAAHALTVLALFWPLLVQGRMLFFRDILVTYYPDLVFLEQSLERGVWPLWNPTSDAGAPFLIAYPPTLALVGLLGARAALALLPPLHLLLALCGTTYLAGRLGLGPASRWLAGVVFGLSGYALSSISLLPLFLALAWAPLVLALYVELVERPSRRGIALLALVLALQTATLAAEIVVQTLVAALFLRVPRTRTAWGALAAAGFVAGLLAAPALLGVRALLAGSARAAGLSPEVLLGYSAPPAALLEALLPRFLGEVHTFSDVGFWGQPFFPTGFPYFLSLYLGPVVLLLAVVAGRDRLWLLAGLGVLLSLGAHGPLGTALEALLTIFRGPVKFFFLTTLALALLAGRGLDRVARGRTGVARAVLIPGLALLASSGVLALMPGLPAQALGGVQPALAGWQGRVVAQSVWPSAFLWSGLLATLAGLALRRGRQAVPIAAAAALVDLLLVNGALNPSVEPSFYELRPPMRELVERLRAEGSYRVFSCGLAATPPPRWRPEVAARNSDEDLFRLERQSLLPRTHVLDGLEGALDEDRTGLVPREATLPVADRDPARLSRYAQRLRLANVKWVVSWAALPPGPAELVATVEHPELLDPLRLFALPDPLPRLFWVPRAEPIEDAAARARRLEDPTFDPRAAVVLESDPERRAASGTTARTSDGGAARVVLERRDPHHATLRLQTPPGFVVHVEGFNEAWQAESSHGPVEVLEANGRYQAFWTPGGDDTIELRYAPAWRGPSLLLAAAGALLVLVLALPARLLPLTRAPAAG